MATLGLSKVFILDKYFTELQKFWENEKRVQVDVGHSDTVAIQQQQQQRLQGPPLAGEVATLRRLQRLPGPNNADLNSNSAEAVNGAANRVSSFWSAVPTLNRSTDKAEQTEKGSSTLRRGNGDLNMRHIDVNASNVKDLIHLSGPITEEAILRILQSRFYSKQYYINAGPILVSINPFSEVGNPLTLSSTRDLIMPAQLSRVVQEAVRQQSETGYPQAIILSGVSGSGKTYTSMLLLRQLFDVAGGGPETDAFKHLSAAFTVLRSLGSAKTQANAEASRIGHFIEIQVTDGALYRTKIHCYFLDQTRVVRPAANEKNYHIFYQMLAGLSDDERCRLHLEGYSVHNLRYLCHGDTHCNQEEDARRFAAWRACLGILGIPFFDVVRVLAAILLLGNVHLSDANPTTLDVEMAELKSVAALLGVSPTLLHQGLTVRTQTVRGQRVRTVYPASMRSHGRDALAKALYCRTVATIVRRANSLKRLCTSGTFSSDSNDSLQNQMEATSQHASTVGTAGSKSSRSMAALNSAVRRATDGFIGILDMFGFENPKPSSLEHLCINLCAETMQHFFNTHVFKSTMESCREEGIHCDVQPDYVDNVPCIDLISSLRTGLLSMLDVECANRGTAETYVQKAEAQHQQNPRFSDVPAAQASSFAIQHFAGKVVYDASDFIETNKDVLADDLVFVFHRQNCNFGFVSHLFGSELKLLSVAQDTPAPRGIRFRISPTAQSALLNGDDPATTLTQDFHTRLDNLLRTLVHAKPHFVRCVRASSSQQPGHFERGAVARQIRSLEVFETVSLMSNGLAHRMRYKAFNSRYKMLAPFKRLSRHDDKVIDDCSLILEYFQQKALNLPRYSNVSTDWALGKRHIFLSEGARQQLECVRSTTRDRAAVLIQATWRGWHFRRKLPALKRQLAGFVASSPTVVSSRPCQQSHIISRGASVPLLRPTGLRQQTLNPSANGFPRPRPQPITCTPPPESLTADRCDAKIIQQTCTLFGIDLDHPPPLPPSRPYTVTGNAKLKYPQTRFMKSSFPANDQSGEVILRAGEQVLVTGASNRRGHLMVQHRNQTFHVPFQFLQLKPSQTGF